MKEGLFLIFLIICMMLFLTDASILALLSIADGEITGYVSVCLYILSIVSFLATCFVIWFLLAMSRVTWSTLPEEELNQNITFMDR